MNARFAFPLALLGLGSSCLSGEVLAAPSQAASASPSESSTSPATRLLTGTVVDQATGKGMPWVRILVLGTRLETRTDERGHFQFSDMPAGEVTLALDEPGIEFTPLTVGAAVLQVTLMGRYEQQEERTVVVRGALRASSTASQTTVTAREIEAVPLRNAEDAMRLVPGLTLVQHGSEGKGHQFFLRGFDAVHGSDLEVTLEGIPLNEWSNVHGQGYVDLGFIVPEAISSLKAVKGPFFDRQGAFAMAGSVDYQLGIAPEDRGLRASYTAGTTNRHRGVVTYSPREGDGEDFVALEGLHDDSFGQNRAIERGSLLTRFRLLDSPTEGSLSVLGAAYWADFELPGAVRNDDVQAGRIGFYDTYEKAGRGSSGRALLGLRYEQKRGRHALGVGVYAGVRRLELLENYTGFLLDPLHGDRRLQKQSTLDFGVSMDDTLDFGERVSVDYGASVHGDLFEQSQDHVDQQEAPLSVDRSLSGLQVISSVFSSLRLRPIDPLLITLGGRLDVVQIQAADELVPSSSGAGTLVAASPRVTSEWRVADPWRLFLSYGRGFRPPEARAFSSYKPPRTGIADELYDGGEPSMTYSDAVELGSRIRASRYLGIMASGFATFIAREAVFDHVSGINLELNRTRRLGVELDLRSNPTSWLLLEADATLVDARFVDSGNPVPFAPWLSGGVRAVVTHPSGWRAGVRFFGLAPRALPHGATGAPMALLDATLGYHWEHVHLDLAVENLLNLRVREGEYHYASDWDPQDGASQIPVIQTVAGPPLNARLGVSLVY